MDRHLWITVGVSGSGKTTWALDHAKKNGLYMIICRDDYRAEVLSFKKKQPIDNFKWADWKWKWESEVDKLRDRDLDVALEKGANIILADTNLSSRNYEAIANRFKKEGYQIHFQYFPISWDEAISRNAHRKNGVSYSVLQGQFEKWYQMFPEFEPYNNIGTYHSVIVDIDGTVAQMVNRGPYDWSRVGEDSSINHIVDLVFALWKSGKTIIFMSGRDGSCEDETRRWLNSVFKFRAAGFEYLLFMREANDQRKDNIVKRELLDKIPEEYYIQMVIDDRPQVCRMWRQLGLNVLQVADPYKEF